MKSGKSQGKCVLAYGQLPRATYILTQNVLKRNYLLGKVAHHTESERLIFKALVSLQLVTSFVYCKTYRNSYCFCYCQDYWSILLYHRCLHYASSACILPLSHCDSTAIANLSGNSRIFWKFVLILNLPKI